MSTLGRGERGSSHTIRPHFIQLKGPEIVCSPDMTILVVWTPKIASKTHNLSNQDI